jgi:23S rRNA (guanosine2251-2'-O)-methyltransferase
MHSSYLKGVGALNEDAILTSAGAEELADDTRASLMKAVDDLHLNGIKVYAAESLPPSFEMGF